MASINILLIMPIDLNNIIIIVVCIIISIIIMTVINRDKFSLNCKNKEVKVEYYNEDKQFNDNIQLIINNNKTHDNDLL